MIEQPIVVLPEVKPRWSGVYVEDFNSRYLIEMKAKL